MSANQNQYGGICMKLPDEVIDKICDDVKAELKGLVNRTKDEKPTFDNLEGQTFEFGQILLKRVLEEAIEEEQKNKDEKKNAQNAERQQKAAD
jgi:hypothetical protein